MGFQPPPGFRPGGPERDGQPSPTEVGGAVATAFLAFGGVMAAGVLGLAAGEAQRIIENSLSASEQGILNDMLWVLAEPLVRAQVMYDVSPFVAMVVGELLIGAVVVAANSAIEAFVTRKNF